MGKIFKGNGSAKDLSKQRDKQLIPIVQEIIKIILEANLPVGELHANDNAKFDHVAKQILTLMLEHKVKYVDKDYLFSLVLQPLNVVKETVDTSLKMSFDNVINKSLGKDFREVTLEDMDRVLRFEKN